MHHANIARPVAQHGEGLLRDAGKDQLAFRAVRQRFTGLRINDLNDKMILVHVHSVLPTAFKGDARADDFRQTVAVKRAQTKLPLDLKAHFVRPRFRAENTRLQVQIFLAQSVLAHHLRDVQRVRGSAAEHRRAEIAQKRDLPLCVSGGCRNRRRTDAHCAAVRAKAARKQAVAVGDVDDVLVGASGRRQGARAAVVPDLKVMARVADHDLLSGRAA